MKNILITGAGGPAAVALIKALQGPDRRLHAVDMDPNAVGLYMVPQERRALVPGGRDRLFIARLQQLCLQWNIDVLIPTVDVELLQVAKTRQSFMKFGTRVMLTSQRSLELCLDKWALAKHCAGVVRLPQTQLLDERFDPVAVSYPLIVKPRQGSGSRGVVLCHRPEDMERFTRDGSLLVQEFLPGQEYSVDVCISRNGEPIAAVPRARLKVDSGVAVAGRTVQDPELQREAVRAAMHVGLTGVVNVQLRRDTEGRPALLEINPRFPGTMSLTIASGVDMPNLALMDLFGGHTHSGGLMPFKAICMVRHWAEIYMAPEHFQVPERTFYQDTNRRLH